MNPYTLAHTCLLIVLSFVVGYAALMALLESLVDAHALMQMLATSLIAKIKSRRADRARRQGDFLRALLFVIVLIELWI
jgi:hypothetical protein